MKLICSESDMLHKMVISVTSIEGEPMSKPYMDELNRKVFHSYITDLTYEKTGEVWQKACTFILLFENSGIRVQVFVRENKAYTGLKGFSRVKQLA